MTGEFSAETNWARLGPQRPEGARCVPANQAHVRAIGNGTITPEGLTDFEYLLKVLGMPVKKSS
eukprot:8875417-Heterocapsa_arctica.AAC.1